MKIESCITQDRKNKPEAQHGGFGFGRRSKGAGEWRFLFPVKYKTPEQSGLCSDAVAEGKGFEPL